MGAWGVGPFENDTAADFAGARADIAARRKRGEASVRRANVAAAATQPAAPLQVAPPPPGTLYHVGTLRGGQALQDIADQRHGAVALSRQPILKGLRIDIEIGQKLAAVQIRRRLQLSPLP